MTIATEAAVLAAAKASVTALTPASPASAATSVMMYPDDYTATAPALPFVVVRQEFGRDQVVSRGFTSKFRNWTLVIEVYTGSGTMAIPSAAHAASELKKRQWWLSLMTWLISDVTLSGTVHSIGDPELFSATERAYLQWNQDAYDGLYLVVPVRQEIC